MVSPPWQRTHSGAFVDVSVFWSMWHWLQKPKSQLKMWWCLHLGREHLMELLWMSLPFDSKGHWLQNLSPNLRCDGVSTLVENTFWSFCGCPLPFDQQVTLTSKTKVPTLWMGFVSAFWSAKDTDFKNQSSNFMDGVCLCLLISKGHWLQKTKSQL